MIKTRNLTEQWHRDNDYKWMSDDQWECFEMLCDICGGAHHIGGKAKPSGTGITINISFGFHAASFDYSGLTMAVIMAHDRSIRFEIAPSGPKKLRLFFHKRNSRTGEMHLRHPTLEDAIKTIRKKTIGN